MNIFKTIKRIYHNKLITIFLPTTVSCLQKELRNCTSVLDVGCGPSSPLQYCKNIKHSLGVEAFRPYLEKSKKQKIHSKYLNKKIEDLNFPDESFDAVIAIEVIEHLPKKLGLEFIKKASRWAKKKVVITTPNGFINQISLDGNKLQKHLSGWTINDFSELGFNCKGLSGLKILRQEVQNNTMGNDLTASIKYKPKLLWFIVASISQTFTYYLPTFSFELFCQKTK